MDKEPKSHRLKSSVIVFVSLISVLFASDALAS
jgi:hypothetical protein